MVMVTTAAMMVTMMVVTKTTTKTYSTHHSKLLNLLGREETASFQSIPDNLVPHLVSKISQLSFLSQNGLGTSFWIGPQ
jgi:hypothetical protein